MTHFPVLVKISADKLHYHGTDVRRALEALLAPYDEDPKDQRFLAFNDKTDEAFKKYDTASNYEGVPYKSLYKTFDAFCRKEEGYTLNAEGKYGYESNPNAKWDWWSIGGRWLGFFPVKEGTAKVIGDPGAFGNAPNEGAADIIKVADLDRDAIQKQMVEKAEAFFDEYARWLNGEKFDAWDGPRDMAVQLGLARVEKRSVEAGPGEVAFPWKDTPGIDAERSTWTDVATRIERDAFLEKFLCCFNPIAAWATLDDDGWHEPGKMGWFACSGETPEQYVAYKRAFMEKFIDSAVDDDILVCVDCHI